MHPLIILILIATSLLGFPPAAVAEVAVIAHPEVGTDSIDANTLQAFYLDKSRQWSAGSRVTLAVNANQDLHARFLEAYIGKNPDAYANFRKRLVFTGKGRMPASFDSDSALIDFVAQTPGAVGYVDAASLSEVATVKRLTIH